MQQTFPSVQGGQLYQSDIERDPILVGSPAWYDWLEHHSSFDFYARGVVFHARKRGTESGDLYWEVTSAQADELKRIRLGHAESLSQEWLLTSARTLSGEYTSTEAADESSTQSALATYQSQTPQPPASVDPLRSMIRTKLYRPRSSSDVIPRARLQERLNAGLGGKVTLVCAPAGFGKTTLLAEWVETIDRPCAWLSLDERDNELRTFVHSLTAALQSVFPDAFKAAVSLCNAPQFPAPDQVATLFINELADVPDDVLLVLDDYHLMHASEVHSLLTLLIERLPLQLHLVLTSRSDPPLPLAKWRAKGYLHELSHTDLRFTLEETEAFLARMLGSATAHEVAVSLEERTEGWIALLRLAALSLRNTSDQEAFMERLLHIPDRSMSSYLVEEVLSQQTTAVQLFLERTSILDEFCAELCVATIDVHDSHTQVQVILDWLERANLFLVPLDKRHGWYRFHHLFQQLLQQRLQANSSTEELARLHRRASAWYAEHGLIEEALGQALAAGDAFGAAQLVEAHFFPAFELEQWVLLERWLDLLPEEQIQGSPVLLVAKAWIVQARGQYKDLPPLLTAAEHLLATNGSGASDRDDTNHRSLHALIAILWSIFQNETGQVQACLEHARSALAWLQPGEEYIASYAISLLTWSYQSLGQEDLALLELNKALREQSTHLNSTARLLFAQALVYLSAGKLHQVEHTARHMLQTAQEGDLALSYNWANWLLGVASYEWNKLDAALYHFSAVIANQHQTHFDAVLDAMCGLALTYHAQGLSDQAQQTARTLLELVQGQHNIRELMRAYALCGHLALLQGEVEEAEQWLEMAGEQEVAGRMLHLVELPISKVRLLLSYGDQPNVILGQALLDDLLRHVEARYNSRKTIQVLALQAWAYDLQGREAEALEVLERALVLARPGGFVRTFADIAPLAKVLQALRKRRRMHLAADKQLDSYLHRIQVAMSPLASAPGSKEELLRQEGLEPLTERELHILHLLDRDLTNKEIARELVVTPGTVKVHTSNVYRKLSVNNRRAAVTLANALGLLTAH